MSRKCTITGKRANNASNVSHSNRHTKRLQQANLQYKRLWWAEGDRWVKIKISTKALKTIDKIGLVAMAKRHGINLNDF